MPSGQRRREGLTSDEIKSRVQAVMNKWQSYHTFADLFDALLIANDNMETKRFARLYTERTGNMLGATSALEYRHGTRLPTYHVIADIINYNLLSLNPSTILPRTQSQPAGCHRVALFTAAGLIEVSPETVQEWNTEVIARHARLLQSERHGPLPTWRAIMQKLISFHTQGERVAQETFDQELRSDPASSKYAARRISALLAGHAIPGELERLALAKLVMLTDDQVRYIEQGIEAGTIPIDNPVRLDAFAALLTDTLSRLRDRGICGEQLIRESALPGHNGPELTRATLSFWKNGKSSPTLHPFRGLVRALRRYLPGCEIDALIAASGFTLFDVEATTHDVISRADGATHIKTLLAEIRNASDLSVPLTAIDDVGNGSAPRPVSLPRGITINCWERFDTPAYPTGEQVRELLERYSIIMRQKDARPLSTGEIEKVIALAEHQRTHWMALSPAEKLRATSSATTRNPPSPSFQ
jgi:hypothetical protein